MSLRQSVLRDETRRHCPTPATVLLTWKILQVVLFIYLIKHQPSSTCTSGLLCEASEESHGCSNGALVETVAEILDSDPF